MIYTADHGDCLGAHKLIEKGEFMYDEIYRIPLVVSHPDCTDPGSVNDDFVYLQEITCSAIEAAVPDHLDGKSFESAMKGDHAPSGREDVFCVFDNHFTTPNQRMVRTKTHQFTFNPSDIGELYDLVEDPYQLDNRFGDPAYADVQADLIARMGKHTDELGDPVRGWFHRTSPVY